MSVKIVLGKFRLPIGIVGLLENSIKKQYIVVSLRHHVHSVASTVRRRVISNTPTIQHSIQRTCDDTHRAHVNV